jgi:hypothetical protein
MSEVKVNKISPRTNCGTVTLGDSGDSFAIATCASFKTKDVKDTSGNIIISRCGSNITIGSSGAAVALAAGATQSGFGASGAVSWNTTKITTNPNPAVSGVGYFCDTSSAAFTVTLPAAPSAGAIVGIRDYSQTFATNNLTVGRNSQPIDGLSLDLILSTNGIAITLVYVDATQGWKSINSNEIINQIKFVAATGGTITTCGNYKIHTFTGPGTFTVSCAGNPAGSSTVDYLVVAGGGGGATGEPGNPLGGGGGGGGAGGFRESKATGAPWTASPLATSTSLPVSAIGYPITVGGGGPGGPGAASPTAGNPGVRGSDSVFSTITSAGGGAGGGDEVANPTGPGGSGGGSGGDGGSNHGTGNTPPVSPPQGQPGGEGNTGTPGRAGEGGGGATAAGTISGPGTGNGGTGATTSITGSPVGYAGGGGGGAGGGPIGNGTATQGGGAGPANNGSTNTGGGAGGRGAGSSSGGGTGGSGIVVIRYKFQ